MTEQGILPALESRRLILEGATRTELDALLSIWNSPEVRRFLFDGEAVTEERAAGILAQSQALAAQGLGLWTIRLRDRAGLLGCVALLPARVVGELEPRLAGLAEPLVALSPEAWHRGYATEALNRAIQYAFGDLGLSELAAGVDMPNVASHRMVTRAGFEILGEHAGPRYRLRTYRLASGA